MLTLLGFITWVLITGSTLYYRLSLRQSVIITATALIGLWAIGLIPTLLMLPLALITAAICAPLLHKPSRLKHLTKPILSLLKKSLPAMSKTERVALEAGTVWWDGELFTGNPQWKKLIQTPPPKLTPEEQAFIDGPVDTLCTMLNDWEITHHHKDLPTEVWDYIKANKFFGLIIPKKYGGLEFSAYAHSEILTKLAGYSITATTVVSVPNSLGPAELLHQYGTEEQKDYYLPRLACGNEIPCFALTSPEAGSDATSIPDTGIVCRENYNGKETLGIRINWDKRYITLAPVATVLGLAFKVKDPGHLLGDKESLGITCALIPTTTPGVTIGNRHLPLMAPFQNGPTTGQNVFIPMDWIIGGPKMIGEGWRMLVECLSCGRAISLPSCSAGGSRVGLAATGAYAKIRQQFNQPIGKFEGIEHYITRIVNHVYTIESARQLTAWMIDQGERPSVLGAIIKADITERGRLVSQDAMDIHAGKAIMMGPKNYIAHGYMNAPIGITVEGANILTRNLIIFGQGVMRCHPFIKQEMDILQGDEDEQLPRFDRVLRKHIGFTLSNAIRSLWMALTKAHLVSKPTSGPISRYYQQLTWGSSAFALISDICLLTYGGKLKFKEKMSARLGHLLTMLYLGSCALKRFEDQGRPIEDQVILDWCVQDKLYEFWSTMDEILKNFPNRWLSFALRLVLMPLGRPQSKPSDKLERKVAQLFQSQNASRDRLVADAFIKSDNHQAITELELAFKQVLAADAIESRLKKACREKGIKGDTLLELIEKALKESLITDVEAKTLATAAAARKTIIAVDDFTKEEVSAQLSMPSPSKKKVKKKAG